MVRDVKGYASEADVEFRKERSVEELPEVVKQRLPTHAREIYQKAHDAALEQYRNSKERRGGASLEETAHKVAWAAVKKEYEKDESTGQWHPKPGSN